MKKKDPFFDAPVLPKVFPLLKSKKAKEKKEVRLKDLDKLTCHLVLFRRHKAEIDILHQKVRSQVMDQFSKDTYDLKRKPDSFLGVEEIAQARCELRRKGSNIPLSKEVVEKLDQLNIPYNKGIRVPERLVIDPELNQEALAELKDLLKKTKFKSVIQKQPEEYINTVSDETLDEMGKKLSLDQIKETLKSVTFSSISRHKLHDESIMDGNKAITENAKQIAEDYLKEFEIAARKAAYGRK